MGYLPDVTIAALKGAYNLGLFFRLNTATPICMWFGVSSIPAVLPTLDAGGTIYYGAGLIADIPDALEVLMNGTSDRVDWSLSGVSADAVAAIVGGASFTGTIGPSSNTLTVASSPAVVGTIATGAYLNGAGIAPNTLITAGSGMSWTLSGSPQTVGPEAMSTGAQSVVGLQAVFGIAPLDSRWQMIGASFTGTIGPSSNTLTVDSLTSGALAIGQYVTGAGVAAGTVITAGSGSSWTVSGSPQTVGPEAMQAAIGIIPIWEGTADFWGLSQPTQPDVTKPRVRVLTLATVTGDSSRAQPYYSTWTNAIQAMISITDRFCERVSRYYQGQIIRWPHY